MSRGGWTRDDRFVPIPYVDPIAAEKLFRHKVFEFLLREELISLERVELLSSWRHSGFSVHNSVYVPPGDQQAVEALVRYMLRAPVSLARLRLMPGGDQVLHFPKTGGDDPGSSRPEPIDAMEYVARVLAQIPPPRKHLVRYHGYYSKRWADLLRRVYEVDPLVCPRCSATMRIVGFITRRETIDRILDHLRRSTSRPRSPPVPRAQMPAACS